MGLRDYIGEVIDTSIGNLKIKKIKYTGMATGANNAVVKMVRVETECGSSLDSSLKDLQDCLVKGGDK